MENTNKYLVWATTGIDKPVVKPFEIVPRESIPVNAGARVTIAPATLANELFGVGEDHNCAVIVTVVPTNARATVVLKYAASDVIVPQMDQKIKYINT